MHLGSLESTQEARKKNFPRESITRYTHAKHETILKFNRELALIGVLNNRALVLSPAGVKVSRNAFFSSRS